MDSKFCHSETLFTLKKFHNKNQNNFFRKFYRFLKIENWKKCSTHRKYLVLFQQFAIFNLNINLAMSFLSTLFFYSCKRSKTHEEKNK